MFSRWADRGQNDRTPKDSHSLSVPLRLILYGKPGCHLCEGLQEKLEQIDAFPVELEVRDITTNPDWFAQYEYTIPVLTYRQGDQEIEIPRLSPRASVQQVAQTLQKSVKL